MTSQPSGFAAPSLHERADNSRVNHAKAVSWAGTNFRLKTFERIDTHEKVMLKAFGVFCEDDLLASMLGPEHVITFRGCHFERSTNKY